MCKGIIAKILLFVINFSLWIAGILLIVFGSIGLTDQWTMIQILTVTPGMEYLIYVIDVYPLLEGVSIFMIVLGSLLFLFAWVGCHGAAKQHKISLLIFFVSLIFAIAAELALIIYAAVYPSTTTDYLKSEMYNSLANYDAETIESVNGTIKFSTDVQSMGWQNLQSMTHCCGAGNDVSNGYKDYVSSNLTSQFFYAYNGTNYTSQVPPTCCRTNLDVGVALTNAGQIDDINLCMNASGPDVNYIWRQSCWKGVEDMMYQYNYISIITCCCLIAAEVLAVILTFRLWRLKD